MNNNSTFNTLPEWHSQDAVILVWPHKHSDWAQRLSIINNTYTTLTKTISRFEKVIIIAQDDEHIESIQHLCAQANCQLDNCQFYIIPTNDTWVRDYGPQTVWNGEHLCYLDFGFNAWGEQYAFHHDQKFTQHLLDHLHLGGHRHSQEMILEGGNIDFNQQGDLLTNLRSFQTNSQYQNNDEIAQHLKDVFSPRHLLALDLPPLQGDDTGGHIDTLARFINDDTIVYASCDDPYQADHSILQELKHQLEHQCQKHQSTHNTEYKILPMTMPSKTFKNIHGERCPASYVNFCFINEAVLVPQYDDEKDADAIQLLQQQLPMKKVIGINALALIEQFGSLHCATLHLPKGSL